MELRGWLRSLGLEQYEAVFRENAIDDTVLLSLTAQDLKDLGVGIVGHRRKLLDAIAALGADANRKRPAPEILRTTNRCPKEIVERRHLTVMFCDLVDSTPLAAQLDPEDLRALMNAYWSVVTVTIQRFGGFIARYLGDGVLAYFGWPQASEIDAERAVRAGLATVDAVGGIRTGSNPLRVRVGIASGLVVIGDISGSGSNTLDMAVTGEAPNLSARMQALAEPNTVLIAHSTHAQIGDLFDCTDLGRLAVKGYCQPVHVWRVHGDRTARSHSEALHAERLSPLIGRDEEMEILMRRWEQAKRGQGRVVLITGEPGIGKSRLVIALEERLSREAYASFLNFCAPNHEDSALHPFIARMERAAGFDRKDFKPQRPTSYGHSLRRTKLPKKTWH